MKRTIWAVATVLVAAMIVGGITRPAEVTFQKVLIDNGASETCAFADINGDGRLDIVSGEFWYEAPKWIPHRFRELSFIDQYIDDFADLPLDVNGDGRIDIITCEGFEKRLVWMENPGDRRVRWAEHEIDQGHFIEFGFLMDLDNDGRARELLPNYLGDGAPTVWFEPKNGAFLKHVVSATSHGHGIGVGDVNGDGRNDILTPKGWFEAPPDVRNREWVFHPDFELGTTGFLHVLDINGDGRSDIVTSLAHDYGILWLEQAPGGKWTKHVIDDSWSQAHSVALVDVNGDRQKDLLTGKRYMAHNGRDSGEREPLGVYWYEYRKTAQGEIAWVKHVIDYSTRTGGGIEIATGDLNGDGAADFGVGGKSGLYLFESVSRTKETAR